MKLSAEQKIELRIYIFNQQKYRETFNEVYDHLINALADSAEPFSVEQVAKIINEDFGGFNTIRAKELQYQKQLNEKYITEFRNEMLNTFRWPDLLGNLSTFGFCFCIYFGSQRQSLNTKPMLIGIIICFLIVAIYGYYKILANKIKHSKYSILDNYVGYISTLGVVILNALLFTVILKDSIFEVTERTKLIATLILFFSGSIYVRSFLKFYNSKIKVLTA